MNKFEDAKNWLAGYTEQGWWGQPGTTYDPRTEYFYKHIGNQWKLGSPIALTINKTTKADVEITFNGVKLSKKTFNGKFFNGHYITLSGKAPEGKTIVGWKATGVEQKQYNGETVTLMMPDCTLDISPVLADATGIETIETSDIRHQTSDIYDLLGNKVKTPQAGKLYIQNGKKTIWR